MYTKFWVPRSLFYHVHTSEDTLLSLLLKMASGGCLRASGNVVKHWPRDPKLGIHSDSVPISRVDCRKDFKNFGQMASSKPLFRLQASITPTRNEIKKHHGKTQFLTLSVTNVQKWGFTVCSNFLEISMEQYSKVEICSSLAQKAIETQYHWIEMIF